MCGLVHNRPRSPVVFEVNKPILPNTKFFMPQPLILGLVARGSAPWILLTPFYTEPRDAVEAGCRHVGVLPSQCAHLPASHSSQELIPVYLMSLWLPREMKTGFLGNWGRCVTLASWYPEVKCILNLLFVKLESVSRIRLQVSNSKIFFSLITCSL